MTPDQIDGIIKAAKCGTIVAHVEAMLNAEREACAALCEGLCINLPDDPLSNSFDGGCRTSAKAIRARGEKA